MKKITFLLAALILFSCAEEQKEKPLVFVPGSYVLNRILSTNKNVIKENTTFVLR